MTTVGRVSGRPHTIEIWFALEGTTLYLLSGGGDRSDWVRNLRRDPRVRVRIRDRELAAHARPVTEPEEDERARTLVFEKYRTGYGNLESWRRSALPVAIDLR